MYLSRFLATRIWICRLILERSVITAIILLSCQPCCIVLLCVRLGRGDELIELDHFVYGCAWLMPFVCSVGFMVQAQVPPRRHWGSGILGANPAVRLHNTVEQLLRCRLARLQGIQMIDNRQYYYSLLKTVLLYSFGQIITLIWELSFGLLWKDMYD